MTRDISSEAPVLYTHYRQHHIGHVLINSHRSSCSALTGQPSVKATNLLLHVNFTWPLDEGSAPISHVIVLLAQRNDSIPGPDGIAPRGWSRRKPVLDATARRQGYDYVVVRSEVLQVGPGQSGLQCKDTVDGIMPSQCLCNITIRGLDSEAWFRVSIQTQNSVGVSSRSMWSVSSRTTDKSLKYCAPRRFLYLSPLDPDGLAATAAADGLTSQMQPSAQLSLDPSSGSNSKELVPVFDLGDSRAYSPVVNRSVWYSDGLRLVQPGRFVLDVPLTTPYMQQLAREDHLDSLNGSANVEAPPSSWNAFTVSTLHFLGSLDGPHVPTNWPEAAFLRRPTLRIRPHASLRVSGWFECASEPPSIPPAPRLHAISPWFGCAYIRNVWRVGADGVLKGWRLLLHEATLNYDEPKTIVIEVPGSLIDRNPAVEADSGNRLRRVPGGAESARLFAAAGRAVLVGPSIVQQGESWPMSPMPDGNFSSAGPSISFPGNAHDMCAEAALPSEIMLEASERYTVLPVALNAFTQYKLSVAAGNSAGYSSPSEESPMVMSEASVPRRSAPPVQVRRDATSMTLIWAAPYSSGTQIANYTVEYRTLNPEEESVNATARRLSLDASAVYTASDWAPVIAQSRDTRPPSRHLASNQRQPVVMWNPVQDVLTGNIAAEIVSGLDAGQGYEFRVKSANSAGESAWSEMSAPLSVTGAVPGKPVLQINTTAEGITRSQRGFWWLAPESNGLAIQNYTIQIETPGTDTEAGEWIDVWTGRTLQAVVELVVGRKTNIRIFATNALGPGVPSEAIAVATDPDVPEPAGPAFVPVELLPWLAPDLTVIAFPLPASTNGREISEYDVRIGSRRVGSTEIPIVSSTWRGVQTALGITSLDAAHALRTTLPLLVQQSFVLQLPDERCFGTSNTPWPLFATNASSLQNGTAPAQLEMRPSVQLQYVDQWNGTTVSLPADNITAIQARGNASLHAMTQSTFGTCLKQWDVFLQSANGSAIAGRDHRCNGDPVVTDLSSDRTVADLDFSGCAWVVLKNSIDVRPGEISLLQVQAINSQGASAVSRTTKLEMPSDVPQRVGVTDVSAEDVNSRGMTLRWALPANGGSPLLAMRVEILRMAESNWGCDGVAPPIWSEDGSDWTTFREINLESVMGEVELFLDRVLCADSVYTIRIRSRNSIGWSRTEPAEEVNIEIRTTQEPAPPTGFTVNTQRSDRSKIALSWLRPAQELPVVSGYVLRVHTGVPNSASSCPVDTDPGWKVLLNGPSLNFTMTRSILAPRTIHEPFEAPRDGTDPLYHPVPGHLYCFRVAAQTTDGISGFQTVMHMTPTLTCGTGLGPNPELTDCVACPAGSASAGGSYTSVYCELCKAGTYAEPAAARCTTCAEGLRPNADATACDACPANHFSVPGMATCKQCPAAGVNCAGGKLAILPGVWSRESTMRDIGPTTEFYPCLNEDACIVRERRVPINNTLQGGLGASGAASELVVELECREGHTGLLCAECKDGYAMQGGLCAKCWDPALSASVAAMALVAIITGATVLIRRSVRPVDSSSIILRMAINYLQMNAIMGDFSIRAPALFREVTGYGNSVSNGVSLELFPVQCTAPFSYTQKFWIYSVLPLLVAVIPWVVILGRPFVVAQIKRLRRFGREAEPNALKAPRLRFRMNTEQRRLWQVSVLVLLFLIHAKISTEMLSMFHCYPTKIYGMQVLQSDVNTGCWTLMYSTVAGLAVVAYAFGIPATAFFLLYRNRAKLRTPLFRARLGFLYDGYTPVHYFWESVVVTRKVFLVVIAIFGSADPFLSAYFGSVLLIVSLVTHVRAQPYREAGLNRLETVSLACTLATQMSTICYWHRPDWDTVLTIAMIFINAFVVLYFAVAMVMALREETAASKSGGKSRGQGALDFVHRGSSARTNPLWSEKKGDSGAQAAAPSTTVGRIGAMRGAAWRENPLVLGQAQPSRGIFKSLRRKMSSTSHAPRGKHSGRAKGTQNLPTTPWRENPLVLGQQPQPTSLFKRLRRKFSTADGSASSSSRRKGQPGAISPSSGAAVNRPLMPWHENPLKRKQQPAAPVEPASSGILNRMRRKLSMNRSHSLSRSRAESGADDPTSSGGSANASHTHHAASDRTMADIERALAGVSATQRQGWRSAWARRRSSKLQVATNPLHTPTSSGAQTPRSSSPASSVPTSRSSSAEPSDEDITEHINDLQATLDGTEPKWRMVGSGWEAAPETRPNALYQPQRIRQPIAEGEESD